MSPPSGANGPRPQRQRHRADHPARQVRPDASPSGRSCSHATSSTRALRTPRTRRSVCLRWRTTTSACTTRKRSATPRTAAALEDTRTNIARFAGRPSDGITGSVQEGGDQPRTRERANRGANTEPRPAEQGGRHEEGSWAKLIDGGRRRRASRCTFEAGLHQPNRIQGFCGSENTQTFTFGCAFAYICMWGYLVSLISRCERMQTCDRAWFQRSSSTSSESFLSFNLYGCIRYPDLVVVWCLHQASWGRGHWIEASYPGRYTLPRLRQQL